MTTAVGLGIASYFNYRRFMPAARPLNDRHDKVTVTPCYIEANGRSIYGELLTPAGSKEKLPVVICSHGFGSHYSLTKAMVGKPFAMSGCAAFCFDFCGGAPRNKSSGHFHDMTIFTEKEDLLAVIDYVKSLPQIDPKRLYLLGESQGGIVSAITAPKRAENIRAMVLYYPAFCIPFDAREKYPSKDAIADEVESFNLKIGGEYYRSVYDFDVYQTIRAYTGPVLILHGGKDAVVPLKYGEMGAETYQNCELHILPGEPHGWTGKGKRAAAEMSFAFLSKYGLGIET